jgi:hypothetical protein
MLGAVRPVSPAVWLAWITVFWSAAVVAMQHVVPYERVWLFALPLYLMIAAAGLVRMISLLQSLRARAVLAYGAAIAVVGVLTWQVLADRQVEQSIETGTLREAPALTAFLKDRLMQEDRVLAWCPSDRPLEYYFRHEGISGHHLVASIGWRKDEPHWHGTRLLAVVNQAHGQTLAALIERYHLAEVSDPSAARLIWQGAYAAVYEIPATGSPQHTAIQPTHVGPRSECDQWLQGSPDEVVPVSHSKAQVSVSSAGSPREKLAIVGGCESGRIATDTRQSGPGLHRNPGKDQRRDTNHGPNP